MHVFTPVNCSNGFCFEMLKKKKKCSKTGFISLFISHLFVYCVLFEIYCFALHPEHAGQHAGILGHYSPFPVPNPALPCKISMIVLPNLPWHVC